MPKMKSHSGTKKRIRRSGSGKLMHEQANGYHGAEQKSSRRKRRLSMDQAVAAVDVKKLKRLLGK